MASKTDSAAASAVPLADLFGVANTQSEVEEGEVCGPQVQAEQQPQQLGSLVVAAELWPVQSLQKGTALPSFALRDALARPGAGSPLLVYVAALDATFGATNGGSLTSSYSTQDCSHVYLRMWRQQGLSALLPADEQAAPGSGAQTDQGQPAASQQAASPGAEQSPAMRTRHGAHTARSPAMRGSSTAPAVAFSPAMRGSSTPPVSTSMRTDSAGGSRQQSGCASPSLSRGIAGASTPQSSGKTSSALPATPHASINSVIISRAAAAASRLQSRAKAEALVSALSLEGAPSLCPLHL